MADIKQLAARARAGTGKGAARAVRREGRIPAIIYGGGQPPVSISLDGRDTTRLVLSGGFLTTQFEIEVDGRKTRVIPRDYQREPVKDALLHIDFLRLAKGATLRLEVPVHFVGQDASPGIERGGTLNVVRHSVELIVQAENIPESLTADISGLDIGDAVHISAIQLPEGAEPTITDRDFTVATLVPPTVFVEPEIVEEVPADAVPASEQEAEAEAATEPKEE